MVDSMLLSCVLDVTLINLLLFLFCFILFIYLFFRFDILLLLLTLFESYPLAEIYYKLVLNCTPHT